MQRPVLGAEPAPSTPCSTSAGWGGEVRGQLRTGTAAELRGARHEVQPVEIVRRNARRLLRTHRLQAADALQLAAAVVGAEGDPATLEVVSLDSRLLEAARREGFIVADIPGSS